MVNVTSWVATTNLILHPSSHDIVLSASWSLFHFIFTLWTVVKMASPEKFLHGQQHTSISGTDWTKCIKCQKTTQENLCHGTESDINTFCQAAQIRADDIFARIKSSIDLLASIGVSWHASCYKVYTSKTNLKRFQDLPCSSSASFETTSETNLPTRSAVPQVD